MLMVALLCAASARAEVPAKLKAGLSSSSIKVRLLSIAALAATKDEAAAVLLVPLLTDDEASVRAATIDALAKLDDVASAPVIRVLMNDSETVVADAATRAVKKLATAGLAVDITGTDYSTQKFPGLSDKLSQGVTTDVKRSVGRRVRVTVPGTTSEKGLHAAVAIRAIDVDKATSTVTVKCEVTVTENPGNILRLSATAQAAVGVEGKLSDGFIKELANDGITACIPSIAKDAREYIDRRAKGPT
jgi:hypothetical protein